MAASHAPDGRRRQAGPWGKKLRKLQAWISRRLGATSAEDDDERGEARDLTVAALLVEVLRADFQVAGQERRQVLAAIRDTLRLDPAR